MNRALSEAFARYGMSVLVLHGGETAETEGIFAACEEGERRGAVLCDGAGRGRRAVLAVPGAGGRQDRDGRLCAVRREAVRRARGGAVLRESEEIAYYWAMLHPKEEEA
ncbi:MAG: hypothetical protein ACLRSD_07380 [Oscillibacter sp.]